MANGSVRQVNIGQEMRDAYLDYAMSVIVARALPDARDGLKPVHRRILYAMHDMGIRADTPYKKSARIVGEVLGKYHPHGDAAVYESMVRLAQDFSMRYQLIDGQGNFGSIDGDGAAAMRYTEARMADIGEELLTDIDKDTVNFTDNFDGSLTEPAVLPCSIPNLLINGSSGIAVGMSTNIPPHNLVEVCDALVYILQNWAGLEEIGIEDLMRFIKGPDFPTGGLVFRHIDGLGNDEDTLVSAYATGRGKITMRAKVHIEDMGRGKSRIIVSELPYQTNKSALIERVANLARDGKLEGLADMRDESDRQGLRLVIELQRGAEPEAILNSLFKLTPLEETFGIIMLALVDGEPRLLTL
ncbi:MAG: DNA gyrase subunit A, partial [Anaerolineae bacterium]|nr:DNA gyrase subunit A [Anaerolineae bacterium]